MRFAACYALVVGVLMILQWAVFPATGQVPELRDEPLRIALHLAGEGLAAAALIAGGTGLLQRVPCARPLAFVALGMLAYTTAVSPG
jgi:hypothetical protein